MRILFLTEFFDPEPMHRGLSFAKKLVAAGHEVEVITAFPNYPGGKIYPGYKLSFIKKEKIDGVQITRLPLYPSHDHSLFKRFVTYATFAFSALFYGLFFAKKPDVMYVFHPPLSTGLCAALIKKCRKIPFVLDIQDLWPDSLFATHMVHSGRLIKVIHFFCQFVYKSSDHICTLSNGLKKALVQSGVPSEKIEVIYNWCDEERITLQEKMTVPLEMQGYFSVIFAGNMGKAQALETILSSAKRVEAKNDKIRFVFIGSGIEKEHLKKQASDQKNIIFLPQLPMNKIGAFLQTGQLLLVHLKDEPLFDITIPSKTQAYLSLGRPILMAVKGDAATLIEEAQAGWCALPENPEDIAEKILEIASLPSECIEEYGKNGQAFYQAHLSMAKGVQSFERIFLKLTAASRAS